MRQGRRRADPATPADSTVTAPRRRARATHNRLIGVRRSCRGRTFVCAHQKSPPTIRVHLPPATPVSTALSGRGAFQTDGRSSTMSTLSLLPPSRQDDLCTLSI
uniref:Uncharacterized protein n=1 Tax=Plectus sambesii TaxID=2011161 RepID=A0A914V124_9BILA